MKTKQIIFIMLSLIAFTASAARFKIRKVPTCRSTIVSKFYDNYRSRITYGIAMAQSNIPTSQAKTTPAVMINQHNRLISPIETNQSLPEGNEISTNESNDDYYAGDAICVNDDNDVNDISINWPLLTLISGIITVIFLKIIANKRGHTRQEPQPSLFDNGTHYMILANGGGVLVLEYQH